MSLTHLDTQSTVSVRIISDFATKLSSWSDNIIVHTVQADVAFSLSLMKI